MRELYIPYRSPRYNINEILKVKLDDNDFKTFENTKFNVVSPERDSNRQYYFRFREGGKYHYLHRIIATREKGTSNQLYEVDHINRDTLDCRASNLRIISRADNARNRADSRHNTSGARGVSKMSSGRYIVKLDVSGVRYQASSFKTLEEASKVYEKFCKVFNTMKIENPRNGG